MSRKDLSKNNVKEYRFFFFFFDFFFSRRGDGEGLSELPTEQTKNCLTDCSWMSAPFSALMLIFSPVSVLVFLLLLSTALLGRSI